jgi:hypothetical protein
MLYSCHHLPFIVKDIFSMEDKKENADVNLVVQDVEKGKELRATTLRYWKGFLDDGDNIQYVEAISGQFAGLELVVYGTRMIVENFIHYIKANAKACCHQL